MNLQSVIQELLNLGMTQTEIAEQCNCRQSSISDIATGQTKNPNFTLGTSLLNLLEKKREEQQKAA